MTSNATVSAQRSRIRAPLVGRQHELGLLEDALADTLATGKPHTVVIMGDPGVGKTRLLREFLADVRGRDDTVRVLTGHGREGGPAFGVVRGVLRSRLGLQEGDSSEASEATFRAAVAEVIGDRRVGEFLHYLGAFLDLQAPQSPFVQVMAADVDQTRRIGRAVLRHFLELDAARRPLLLALEDFQWSHRESVELFQYLIQSVTDVPIMFVVVARPQLLQRFPEWLEGAQGNHIRFDLGPLGHEEAAQMLAHLMAPVGEAPLELLDAGVDLAGGNPYLLEQIVRAFLRDGVLQPQPDGSWRVDLADLEGTQLPLSVDDAISARISALSQDERSLLEMAATLGGVFWLGALVALERDGAEPPEFWSDPEADPQRLGAALNELIGRDYLLQMPDSTIAGDTEYAFKHNLERESLRRYTSKSRAARYHLVIAQWLDCRLSHDSEEHCQLLAQHYELGGARGRAARFRLRAADRARKRYAAARAAEAYAAGLELLGDDDPSLRVEALEHYGEVLQAAGSSQGALSAFEEMRTLAYRLDLQDNVAVAHARLGVLHREGGRLVKAMGHLETAHGLFESAGDALGLATALDAMGTVHALRGKGNAAEHVLHEALDLLEGLGDRAAMARSLNNLGNVYREMLRFEEAEQAFQRALQLWQQVDEPRGIAQSLTYLGVVAGQQGQDDEANALWNKALSVAREVGDRVRVSVVLTCLGSSAYRAGDAEAALSLLQEAESLAATLGDRMQEADTLRSLAKARALIGDLAGAHRDISRAIDIFEHAQGGAHLGVALRTLGEIAARGPWEGRPDALSAGEVFERSMHLLQELGNDMELARTCLAFADTLEGGDPATSDGGRAAELRERARRLLERHKGVSIRPSQPGDPSSP